MHEQDSSFPPQEPFNLLFDIITPMASRKKDSPIINKVNNNCIINFKLNKVYIQLNYYLCIKYY